MVSAWLSMGLLWVSEVFESKQLESVLASAPPETLIYVDFSADWCGPCHELMGEVLVTSAAQALVGPNQALRVDVEQSDGFELQRQYGVRALPTVLVLNAAGHELGRVEGYEGRDSWLEAMSLLKVAYEAETKQNLSPLLAAWRQFQRSGDARDEHALVALLKKAFETPDSEPKLGPIARVYARHLLRRKRDAKAAVALLTTAEQALKDSPSEGKAFRLQRAISEAELYGAKAYMQVARDWSLPWFSQLELLLRYEEKPMEALALAREQAALYPSAQGAYWHWKAAFQASLWSEAQMALDKALALEPKHPTYRYAQQRMEHASP